VDVLQPTSLNEALQAKAEVPDAVPLAGGTDLMVELNFDWRRPPAILDLTSVSELAQWRQENSTLRIGAGVTYTRLISELAIEQPGLAIASRTIGSPQIRNRGTIGGNLGTASPAGDALPVLLATGAEVEVTSTSKKRVMRLGDFITGPKRNDLAGDELITAVLVPEVAGPQQFSKIGTRNAMVIAVASFAVALNTEARSIGTGIGSAGPVPIKAVEAESFMGGYLRDAGLWESRAPMAAAELARFGELVADAATPIDDVRGTAAYRRHALAVMAGRTLSWAWDEYRRTRE
jgi:CO/xanthine dehydrogenase FAD-binding subunit